MIAFPAGTRAHGAWCWYTRGRFKSTHGDVFSSVKHVIFDTSCQSTRATSVDRAAAGSFQPPHARLHALLNASAAGESTTAGGLEAFPLSKLRWSREEPVS